MPPITKTTAPPRSDFEATYKTHPVVFTDLARGWPAVGSWTFASLRERWGHVAMEVAQMDAARVTLSPRKGLTLVPGSLGAFLDRLNDGAGKGYAIARWDGLPAGLRAELPPPAYCEGAFEYVSKLWVSRKGTVSPLHFDFSDNLHTVVLGAKRFQLWAPAESKRLYPHPLHTGIPYVSQVDPERPDPERFPAFAGAQSVSVDVGPGETIFIPRLWWHQVTALEHSATVNAFWAHGAWGAFIATANLTKRLLGMN